jgi:hypothetical protein
MRVFPQHFFVVLHNAASDHVMAMVYDLPLHIHSPNTNNEAFNAFMPHTDTISLANPTERLPRLSDDYVLHLPVQAAATSFTISEHRKLYDPCISIGVRVGGVGIHGYPTESCVWKAYTVPIPMNIICPGPRVHEPRQMQCSVANVSWTSQKWFGSYGRVIHCTSQQEENGTTTLEIFMTFAGNTNVPLAEVNIQSAHVALPTVTYDEGRGRLYLMYHTKDGGDNMWKLNLQIWDL